jgi:hypothetical protein
MLNRVRNEVHQHAGRVRSLQFAADTAGRYNSTKRSCRGLGVARQRILFSLDSMDKAVDFRLGDASIVSNTESHLN